VEVTVRLFAVVRERAGRDRVELTLDDDATVADLVHALGGQPGLEGLMARLPVRVAVNREYADPGARIAPGDELAVIPPVSGGDERVHARVTGEPLSLADVAAGVSDPTCGAIVCFEGTTRDVERLEYEAYVEMAEERIAQIVAEAVERHGVCSAAAEHRVGGVPLSEPSVAVAVSAAHRGEAFAAAREIIDRIKAEAPIWKKEIDGGEERWVEGTTP
jgi:molybdopterin synthase catalytic subunit